MSGEPLSDFEEGQWWILELDNMASSLTSTADQKRAVAVVHNLLDAVRRAQPEANADAKDAGRWRAFLASQRIRPIGSAGLDRPEPNNYAHMGVEIWTIYGRNYSPELLAKMDADNEKGRRWLTQYADIAQAAIEASRQPTPTTDAAIQAQEDGHGQS